MREGKVAGRAPYRAAQLLLLHSSAAGSWAEGLPGSPFARTALLRISLAGHDTRPVRLLPVICDQSLFRMLPIYFRILPDGSARSFGELRKHSASEPCPQ